MQISIPYTASSRDRYRMTSLRTAVRRSLSLSKFLMDFGSSECRPYTQVVAAVSYVISPTAHHPSARPSTALEVLTQAANARQEPFVCQRSDSVSRASKASNSVSIEADSVGTFAVDFGKEIIAITGIRPSQISMLDISFWQISGSVVTVGVRNNGSKRTGTITVSALIRR